MNITGKRIKAIKGIKKVYREGELNFIEWNMKKLQIMIEYIRRLL